MRTRFYLHQRLFYSSFALMLLIGGVVSARAQTFSTTGSMAEPLICQTSTSLQNGLILITGGTNLNYFEAGPDATNHAELYNFTQAQPSFAPTGSMNVARNCGSTATLLNDGTVLIAGGSGNETAELYIPSSQNFSLHTPPSQRFPQGLTIAQMNAVRYHASATLLQDGTVLIAGGDTGNNAGLQTAEIYNPGAGTFTPTKGMMITVRTSHTATLLNDGTVLIAGGEGNTGSGQTAWNTAEIYNPLTQTFTRTSGAMITARAVHTATLLSDGTVLLAGGQGNSSYLSSAETYNPSTGTFTATGSMNSARAMHTATLIADGTILIAGGYTSASSAGATQTAEIYNVSQRSFRLTGSMTVPRAFHSATLLYNGEVLIAGGESSTDASNAFLASAELYSYTVTTATMGPAYKVTSIIYAPPGNKSQAGYTNSTSNSTTTTIGSSFGTGHSTQISTGFSYPGVGGISASESFATSSTSSSMSAFQETYTNATGVTNQSNSAAPDAINHNNDLFLIWLNPQIIAYGDSTAQGPVGYGVGVQPLSNGTIPLPDIVEITAGAMEANVQGQLNAQGQSCTQGQSCVPASALNQQVGPNGQLTPGLASICKNLNKAEYAALSCSLTDQCGCTPDDFLPILKQDPLLFLNGLSNPISPYPATTSPLLADSSGSQLCQTIPPTPGSDCRYVPVPTSSGSTQQEEETLVGPETVGGNAPGNTFQQGENTQTTYTLGGQTQTMVTQTLQINLGVLVGGSGPVGCGSDCGGSSGDGTATGTWNTSRTMTWTDSQSVGTANGSGTTLSVTLNSGTVGCFQNQNIGVFEDTIYHTFVFQQPAGDPSTCTTLTPGFYVTATPTNPNQTALSLGHSINYNVQVSAWNGFNGAVLLSASGLPAGVTASFSPAVISTSTVASSTMTLTAAYSNATFIGSASITVNGTSGSSLQSAILQLTTRPLQYVGSCGVQ
jgi:hypothetical protein